MAALSQFRVMHIISGDLWAGAEVQAFTLLKYLHPCVSLHVVLMNEGELAVRLRALNIQISILPESQLSVLVMFKSLVGLIKDFRPHIIHTHRQKENILGCLANLIAFPLASNRPKSLRTTHGAPEFKVTGKQKLQVWLDAFVGNHLQQAVIAVSDDLAKKLTHAFPKERIHVIYNGVDCNDLDANRAIADFKHINPTHLHIGIIGRIEPVKRVDIFIQMAALLLENPPVSQALFFHVIGDGRLRAEMQALAVSLGVAENLQFHGQRSDMAACVASLDVIVMCSDHEGTPMTALESLALGTPLVAHDIGGLHELLQFHPDFLVQEHHPLFYAESVARYLQHKYAVPVLMEKYLAHNNAADVLNCYHLIVNN